VYIDFKMLKMKASIIFTGRRGFPTCSDGRYLQTQVELSNTLRRQLSFTEVAIEGHQKRCKSTGCHRSEIRWKYVVRVEVMWCI
jgi:hypothetical protein